MELNTLTAISPLDGRYAAKLNELRPIVSEYGLIFFRVLIEIHWLLALAEEKKIKEISFKKEEKTQLLSIIDNFNLADAKAIKDIEKTTNHDVKAIEYFLCEKLSKKNLPKSVIPFIHFAATSEDINNLAYALMFKNIREKILQTICAKIITKLETMANQYANVAMLSRTHGQPASPTTLGKELYNFSKRLQRQYKMLMETPIQAKFNGAVGNFNAHYSAYPDINWPKLSKKFIEKLDLSYNSHTTQIEPHDYIAELLQAVSRFNTILIDLNRDIWGYISLGYFTQRKLEHEVGSSTMPHKINPIDFENSEGNLGLANALIEHLAAKLPISRWQRDLSDSTVLRNLGSVFGYSLLAFDSCLKGLDKLVANEQYIQQDLEQHWEVLAEAIQTVMRRYGITDAYEQLKSLTRGEKITQSTLEQFINSLNIPDSAKQQLNELTPHNYLGCAIELCKNK